MKGYIPLWRSFFDTLEWEEKRKYSRAEAWLDMIAMASFVERDVPAERGHVVHLQRGDIYMSIRQLAQRWGWSIGTVQRYMEWLTAQGRVEKQEVASRVADTPSDTPSDTPCDTHTTKAVQIIKLCNYDRYNSVAAICDADTDTPFDTPSDTPRVTIYNKGYIIKDNNTHSSQFNDLVKFFTGACVAHTREDAEQLQEAAHQALSFIQQNSEAHECYTALDYSIRGMIWLWGFYPHLQLTFEHPLSRMELSQLSQDFERDDIQRIIESMANKMTAGTKRYSFFLTFKEWAACDYVIAQKSRLGNTRYKRYA